MTTSVIYPDTSSATCDGYMAQAHGTSQSWATLVGGDGNLVNHTSETNMYIVIWSENSSALWNNLYRGHMGFDTTGIDDADILASGSLGIYGKTRGQAAGTPNANIYSSSPADPAALAAGDYNGIGSTPLCDTSIGYSSWNTGGYNEFALNSAGLSHVNFDAITQFGTRDDRDVANSAPSFVGGAVDAYLHAWPSEEQQVGERSPRLTLEHGAPFTPKAIMF